MLNCRFIFVTPPNAKLALTHSSPSVSTNTEIIRLSSKSWGLKNVCTLFSLIVVHARLFFSKKNFQLDCGPKHLWNWNFFHNFTNKKLESVLIPTCLFRLHIYDFFKKFTPKFTSITKQLVRREYTFITQV